MQSKIEKPPSCDTLDPLQPCSCTHLQPHLAVLCHAPLPCPLLRHLAQLLWSSLDYYLHSFLPEHPHPDPLSHQARLANLLLTCREEIYAQKLTGQSAFGLCYVYEGRLYCVRSEGVEIYMLEESGVRALAGSRGYERVKRPRGDYGQGYFGIKNEKKEVVFGVEDGLHFDVVELPQTSAKKGSWRVLLGCTHTFDLLNPQLIIGCFKSNAGKSDCEKASLLLQQAKKRLKSVTQQNLSLTCWKPQSEPKKSPKSSKT